MHCSSYIGWTTELYLFVWCYDCLCARDLSRTYSFFFVTVLIFTAALLSQILEAAVVGMPDEILGERVFAVIALRTSSSVNTANTSSLGEVDQTLPTPSVSLVNSQQDPQAILRILRSFLEDRLAQYKQPREYLIVDAIPRNHMGKVRNLI